MPSGDNGDDDDDSSDAWAWFRKNEVDGTYRGFEAGVRAVADAIRSSSTSSSASTDDNDNDSNDEARIDGVIGFSQGGCFASLVAAALETSTPPSGTSPPIRALPDPSTTPSPSAETPAGQEADWSWVPYLTAANNNHPLKFCVVYSGFYTPVPGLQWLLENPLIQTPTAHFIGSLDTVVDEVRSQALAERCADPKVFVHPGGHYVPVAKQWAMALVGYIKETWEKAEKTGSAQVEGGGDKP